MAKLRMCSISMMMLVLCLPQTQPGTSSLHACFGASTHALMHACVRVHSICVCMHVCMHASLHACTHACKQLCTHACTTACMQIRQTLQVVGEQPPFAAPAGIELHTLHMGQTIGRGTHNAALSQTVSMQTSMQSLLAAMSTGTPINRIRVTERQAKVMVCTVC